MWLSTLSAVGVTGTHTNTWGQIDQNGEKLLLLSS